MDTRKIPLEVRKLIAKAYPFDELPQGRGPDAADARSRPSTIMPPAVPGYEKYELPGLTGTGKGAEDPAVAREVKAKLKELGKENFELSWYYANDDKIAHAGHPAADPGATRPRASRCKPIGVAEGEAADPAATTRPRRSTSARARRAGAPTGRPVRSWFPVLFQSGRRRR